VKQAFLIGDTSAVLAAACAAQGVPHTVCASLEEATHAAAGHAAPGDHVLLSPGFASFDMFRGYEHRGDQFEQLVNRLGSTVVVR
jgi:UDP-N-acetylmuramoylalanine--D-glutamate ligase